MARPHHRKKHKEHLRQYQHSQESVASKPKSKASRIFSIVGAVVGLAVSYFVTQGNVVWIIICTLAGAGVGYLFGNSVDRSGEK